MFEAPEDHSRLLHQRLARILVASGAVTVILVSATADQNVEFNGLTIRMSAFLGGAFWVVAYSLTSILVSQLRRSALEDGAIRQKRMLDTLDQTSSWIEENDFGEATANTKFRSKKFKELRREISRARVRQERLELIEKEFEDLIDFVQNNPHHPADLLAELRAIVGRGARVSRFARFTSVLFSSFHVGVPIAIGLVALLASWSYGVQLLLVSFEAALVPLIDWAAVMWRNFVGNVPPLTPN